MVTKDLKIKGNVLVKYSSKDEKDFMKFKTKSAKIK